MKFNFQKQRYEMNDAHGCVFCEQCERMGKPVGGVTYELRGTRVHKSFELPEGWALQAGELVCGPCSVPHAYRGARNHV